MANEKDLYELETSVQKAVNFREEPPKPKHIRAIIIITFKLKDCTQIWSFFKKQPLLENQFTAWKFCHVLHKLLIEGHPTAITGAYVNRKTIVEIGNMWSMLNDSLGLGLLISSYTKFLITKIEFHFKYTAVFGNCTYDTAKLEVNSEGDINYYYQICIDAFDVMDSVFMLQDQILQNLYKNKMNSSTIHGQFRVAPVVLLIEDAKGLYNFSIFLLNKLHSSLPEEMLDGHRSRFSQLFAKLKKFYESLKFYGYITDLVTLPTLPNFEPRFKSSVVAIEEPQIETNASTAPPLEPDYFVTDLIDITADTPPTAPTDVWSIPSTSPDNMVDPGTNRTRDAWIDYTDSLQSASMHLNKGEDVWQLLKEKDALIKQLQDDIVKQQIDHNNEILQMQKELMSIRDELRNGSHC
ncbi:HIP1 family protein [Megaselia abdita]